MQPLAARALALAAKHDPPVAPAPAEAVPVPAPEPSAVRLLTPLKHAQERAAALVGQTIAQRYRIQKLLAMGGMGAVYVGQHLLLKKRVAIKLLHPETEGLPGLVTRFEREAIAGAHIVHPHVAAATDFGQLPDGSYFLVLEYVAGRTLHDLMGQGRIPPARAVHLARQIASALGAAHAKGVVHRDVKPANVMLVAGQDDFAKLIDFGLARVPVDQLVAPASQRAGARISFDALDPKPSLTAVGVVFGTVEYMAPETALGMNAVGPRADLYALGIILYEMLTGRLPFDAAAPAALFAQHRFTPPPSFAEVAPGVEVPPELEMIVMRLLAKDPDARYESSAELIEALDALGLGGATVRPPPTSERPSAPEASAERSAKASRPRGRSNLPFMFAVGAFVIGAAAVAHFRDADDLPAPAAPVAASADPAASTSVSVGSPTSAVASADPAAPASVSAGSPAPGDVVPAAVDPAELAKRRELFLRAVRGRDWSHAEAAFFELAALDPHAYHGQDMVVPAGELTATLDRAGRADKIFDALTSRLGADGLDVVYDLVATRGLSGVALRAAAILRQRDVLARGTPQMRVAFELRDATCVDKLGLLDRAAAEGDERALLVLETQGIACFDRTNKAVNEATYALRARLGLGK